MDTFRDQTTKSGEPHKISEDESWGDDDEDLDDLEHNSENEEIEELLQEEAMTSEKAESIAEEDHTAETIEDEESESDDDDIEETTIEPKSEKAKEPNPNTAEEVTPPKKVIRKILPRSKFTYFNGNMKSYINSSPRRIIRAYKRRAVIRHVAVGRILEDSKISKKAKVVKFTEESDSDSDLSIDREDPLEPQTDPATSINNKLGKYGTTMKKISINDETAIQIVKGPAITADPLVQTKKITFYPKDVDEPVKTVKVTHQPKKFQSYTQPAIPKVKEVPDVKEQSVANNSSVAATSTAPPVKLTGFNKVVLKKSSNGTYSFVQLTDGKSLPPESFPKAIVYSQYDRQKEQIKHYGSSAIVRPSTSAQETPSSSRLKPSSSRLDPSSSRLEPSSSRLEPSISQAITIPPIAQQQTIKPSPMPANAEDLFMIDDDDDDDDISDEQDDDEPLLVPAPIPHRSVPKPHPIPPKPKVKVVRYPQFAAKVKPVKYVIAQRMLMSSNDNLKIVDESSNSSDSTDNPVSCENGDLFVIDQDDDSPKPPSPPISKNRRKASLVPKANEEPLFEEPPFQMPPRPQANIDLIDNLAKYRVLVRSMLKKLNMPQVDFNATEGDEYINMYKIFRN